MAGIYIHIPFCKQKCNYCDFHKSVSFTFMKEMIHAFLDELAWQKDYIGKEKVETIYFGGGTPSVLGTGDIGKLLGAINQHFTVDAGAEITIEANPDDITNDYLRELRHLGINRLSLGLQSFYEEDLVLMNRRHNSGQSIDAVMISQDEGFTNLSVDIIYGLPGMTLKRWENTLNVVLNLNVQHISAYHLTIEQGTVFENWLKKGKIKLVQEKDSVEQFNLLMERAKQKDFIHYEISNFGKQDYFSKHNSNYWKQKKYLGIGPSAHSYNLTSRQWNVPNNKIYLESMTKGNIPFEIEYLDGKASYNDYILTSLRTIWGVNLDYVEKGFGEAYKKFLLKEAQKYIESSKLLYSGNALVLSNDGKFIADTIISALLYAG